MYLHTYRYTQRTAVSPRTRCRDPTHKPRPPRPQPGRSPRFGNPPPFRMQRQPSGRRSPPQRCGEPRGALNVNGRPAPTAPLTGSARHLRSVPHRLQAVGGAGLSGSVAARPEGGAAGTARPGCGTAPAQLVMWCFKDPTFVRAVPMSKGGEDACVHTTYKLSESKTLRFDI